MRGLFYILNKRRVRNYSGNILFITGFESNSGGLAENIDATSEELQETPLLKIWDAENGTLIRTLNGHENSVSEVGFSFDDKLTKKLKKLLH